MSEKKMPREKPVGKSGQSDFVEVVIKHYLPKYLAGEITLSDIEKELNTTFRTLDKTITTYYTSMGDNEGLERYLEQKRKMRASSISEQKYRKTTANEIQNYVIVSDKEFLSLSEEEQDRQIIEKFRKMRLPYSIKSETTVRNATEKIKNYFRSKNSNSKGIENFSEQDIRYIIFRNITLLERDTRTLDTKIDALTSSEKIDNQTAYKMIKSFPGIMAYSSERIKGQLDLLQNENLIDAIIERPMLMKTSVSVMYALIEFAKQRHKTDTLIGIIPTSIFLSNSTLKRLYSTTLDELKERFPYEAAYTINGEEIGRVASDGNVGVKESDAASRALAEVTAAIAKEGVAK